MKKILLATTALVASASFAMAQDSGVDLSGSAEMGIIGGSDDFDTQFHTDIDVTFSLSGETDAGLTFGASIDLDESDDGDAFNNTTQGGEVIFVSGSLGTLTMGDTDGALDFALSEAIIGSAINDDHEHFGYNGNSGLDGTYDGQVARYDYTFGAFGVAVSAEIDDDQDDNLIELVDEDGTEFFSNVDNDVVLGIGVKYSGEFAGISFGAGLGYQRAGDNFAVDTDGDGDFDDVEDFTAEVVGVSLDMKLESGFQAILNYSSYTDVFRTEIGGVDVSDEPNFVNIGAELDSHYGVAVGYEFGQFLVAANYGKFDFNGAELDGYGLIANYDLGGGAALQAGYGHSEFDIDDVVLEDNDLDTFSFGISMSF